MSESLQVKDKLDYAYKWFEYQAGQRLVAFNFLLVLMGALSFGYYTAYQAEAYLYATIAAVFGAFVSLAFYFLDRRNEQLVNIGRRALEHIENLPEFSSLSPNDDPCRLAIHARKRSGYWWLRAIQLVLCGLFFVASLASGSKVIENCRKQETKPSKLEAYYQCPTLNKTDATRFSPEQNRRTRASLISRSAS